MADQNEFDLDNGVEQGEEINKAQKRITSLSSKVKQTAEELEVERKAREDAENARQAAEKERDFYQNFTGIQSKYPGAGEFTDKIKEKVMAGYSPEDAAVAVLNAEGKLTATPPPPPPPPAPAGGGSAMITLPEGGQKSISEMSREEKRAALMEAEKRGDISIT